MGKMVKKGGGRFGLKGARVAVLQGFSAALPLFKRVGGERSDLGQRDLIVFFQDVIVVLQSFLFHRVVRHADAFEEQFLFL